MVKDIEQEVAPDPASLTKPHVQDHGAHTSINVLLGDVGGTNIRLNLVEVTPGFEKPTKEHGAANYLVDKYDTFESALEEFLGSAAVYPRIAVIAIAGPIKHNAVKMSNVEKWGTLSGNRLAEDFKLDHFIFLNDFEAAAYGASVLTADEVIPITSSPLLEGKVKAVVGPGTGLGTAMLFPAPYRKRFRHYVIPGEGGHVNFAPASDLEWEFYNYLRRELKLEHIVLERVFCGPYVPYMFRFFAEKHPEHPDAKDHPKDSHDVIGPGIARADSLYRKALDLFVGIYSSFLGDTFLRTLCYGGLYLVGGLSLSVAEYMRDPKNLFMQEYMKRRPYMADIFKDMPIVVGKEKDLGLAGAFVYARRIVFDLYDPAGEEHKK